MENQLVSRLQCVRDFVELRFRHRGAKLVGPGPQRLTSGEQNEGQRKREKGPLRHSHEPGGFVFPEFPTKLSNLVCNCSRVAEPR